MWEGNLYYPSLWLDTCGRLILRTKFFSLASPSVGSALAVSAMAVPAEMCWYNSSVNRVIGAINPDPFLNHVPTTTLDRRLLGTVQVILINIPAAGSETSKLSRSSIFRRTCCRSLLTASSLVRRAPDDWSIHNSVDPVSSASAVTVSIN